MAPRRQWTGSTPPPEPITIRTTRDLRTLPMARAEPRRPELANSAPSPSHWLKVCVGVGRGLAEKEGVGRGAGAPLWAPSFLGERVDRGTWEGDTKVENAGTL